MPASDHRALQLELALAAGQLGVWEWDREAGTVVWSAEMERLAGLDEGTFDGTFDAYLGTVHPDDRDAVLAAIDEGMAGGPFVVEHRFRHPGGRLVWVEGRGAVRPGDDGEAAGLVGVAIDVTHRVRHRHELEAEQPILRALNRISLQLNREHEGDRLAQTIVEVTAEACGTRAAALVQRPSILHGWAVVAATGDGTLDPIAATEAIVEVLGRRGPSEVGVARAEGTLAVPVGSTLDSNLMLVIADDASDPERAERLLGGIGAHAGTALENARLHELARRELAARNVALAERDEVMRQLQRSLLPPALPDIPGLDLAAGYLPMTEGIGGDFYDVFPLADRTWGIVLGDVCGKGPAAAGITGLARHTLRAAAVADHRPAESVQILNQAMVDRGPDDRTFCTLVDARLQMTGSTVRIVAGVAGHPPLLVLRADGTLESHGPTGHLVGMFDDILAGELTIELGPGDLCVLYTDGATDVRRDGEVFGDDRLADVVHGCRSMSAAAVVRSIEVAVVDFQRGQISDDLAVVAVRVPD